MWLGPQFIQAVQGVLAGAGGAAAGSAAAIGGGIIGGAAAGAVSSIASQGFGIAIGAQSGFSWKGVGLSALGGGIGGGVTGLGQGVPAAGEVAGQFEKVGGIGGFLSRGGLTSAIGRGIATNALTQGIGVATGLQSKFDFAGVAAAGIGAGAADFAGARTASWGSFGSDLATGMASALANAATRSAVSGNSFGDNLIAALPDAIGGALGRAGARGAAALGRALEERASASPIDGGGMSVGQVAEIWVNEEAIQSAFGRDSDQMALQATAADILSAATGGIGLREFARGLPTAGGGDSGPASIVAQTPLREDGAYPGGDMPSGGASALKFLKDMFGMEHDVLVGKGNSFADYGLASSNSATFGAIVAAEGGGLRQGIAADPKGLAQALSVANILKVNSNAKAFYTDVSNIIAAQIVAQNGLASDVVDDGIIGTFVQTGGEFASEAVSLLFLAKDFATGKVSLGEAGAAVTGEGVLAAGAYLLSRGRIKPVVAAETVEAVAINPRLTTRLGKWRDYQAGGGELDMRSWVKATQGQEWGLGGRGGYGDWIKRVESTHGNSLLSNRTAYLYEKVDADGNFLKWGITQDMGVRELQYIGKGERGIRLYEHASGTRADMARMERVLEQTQPGPQNLQPWAVKAWNSGLRRVR